MQEKVDAFIVNPTLSKDVEGKPVSDEAMTQWYLVHIHKPEISKTRRGVAHGLLCTAETSGYNQGAEAVRIAHDILVDGVKPAVSGGDTEPWPASCQPSTGPDVGNYADAGDGYRRVYR